MGKNSTPEAPQYQFKPTTLTQNGQVVGGSSYDPNSGWNVQYNLSDADLARKNAFLGNLSKYESQINTFSPEIQKQFKDIAGAKRDMAYDEYNSSYEPQARNAREDYYSRLGTMDSTAYVDRQGDLEAQKQKSYGNIARQYTADLDTLRQNELKNRYDYLNYMGNGLQNYNNQERDYMNLAYNMGNGLNSGLNNYNLSNYQNELTYYDRREKENQNNAALLSAIAGTAASALPFGQFLGPAASIGTQLGSKYMK